MGSIARRLHLSGLARLFQTQPPSWVFASDSVKKGVKAPPTSLCARRRLPTARDQMAFFKWHSSNGVFQVAFFMWHFNLHLAPSVVANMVSTLALGEAQFSPAAMVALPRGGCGFEGLRSAPGPRWRARVFAPDKTRKTQTRPDPRPGFDRCFRAHRRLDLSDLDLSKPQGGLAQPMGLFTPGRLQARPARFFLRSRGAGSRPWEWLWSCGCLRLTN